MILREVVTCPKAMLAELGFDSRFVWVPRPTHTLVIIVGKREGYIVRGNIDVQRIYSGE